MQCTKALDSAEPKYYTRLGGSGLELLLGFNMDARMIRGSCCGQIRSHVRRCLRYLAMSMRQYLGRYKYVI
jgi:hypothetical protein